MSGEMYIWAKGGNGETVTAPHFNDLFTNARNGTASELSRGKILSDAIRRYREKTTKK